MELKYNGEPDMKTQQLRAKLYFLQFIENKILAQPVHNFEGNTGFYQYMTLYLK